MFNIWPHPWTWFATELRQQIFIDKSHETTLLYDIVKLAPEVRSVRLTVADCFNVERCRFLHKSPK